MVGQQILALLILGSTPSPAAKLVSERMDTFKLPYRKNVSCVVFKDDNFLIVQGNDWQEDFWKFPQGGVEDGEKLEDTAKRELLEELGTDKFTIIGQSKFTNTYDWSESVLLVTKKWRGQTQTFFAVRFDGNDRDIEIDSEELRRYKWVNKIDLLSHFRDGGENVGNYKSTIKKILREFGK